MQMIENVFCIDCGTRIWRLLKMTPASTASSSRKDQYALRSVGISLTFSGHPLYMTSLSPLRIGSRNVSSFSNCCLAVGKFMSATVKC